MPGSDGTGPHGEGPFTGRGMGYCAIQLDPGNAGYKKTEGRGVFDMPRGDGTGPMGLGPMTGRGAWFCAGYSFPGYTNPVLAKGYFGMGRGFFGRGGGRGRRNWFYATGLSGWQRASMGMGTPGAGYASVPELTPQQESDILKNQADALRKQLEDIQGRIEALGKVQAEKSE